MHKGDGFSAKPLGKSLFHCQNVWSNLGLAGHFWRYFGKRPEGHYKNMNPGTYLVGGENSDPASPMVKPPLI